MDASDKSAWDWVKDKIKFLESECDFLRKEIRATKILVNDLIGRKYASSTEEEKKEEANPSPNEKET